MTTELPDRFDLATEPPSEERLATFRQLFPEAMREEKIDVDALLRSLGDWIDTGPERFGLTWPGKAECFRVIQEPSVGTLLPRPDESVEWDTTQNLIIEGDNLEVLKLLQKAYYGKVKLIYIDPPYNTGHEFIYPDNYREGLAGYLRFSGQADEAGLKLYANTESDGRYHSKWLSMMYPRLFLARNLLTEDGTLFVSIDDHEVHNLRLLLNELFGEENFLGCIVRATGTTTGQDSRGFGSSFDYLLCYSKNAGYELGGIPLSEKDEARFTLEDSKGRYSLLQLRKTGNNDRREDRPLMFYPVAAPDGTEVLPIGPGGYESCWRCGPTTYKQLVAEDYIVWKKVPKDGVERWTPYQKYYLEGREKRPTPLWNDLDGNKKATIETKELLGEKIFSNPKPTALLNRIIELVTSSDSEDIILDFFAGSGTTGHAVMARNVVDGGNRRFVLVQLPEMTEHRLYPTIADMTRERVRRAATKLGQQPTLDRENLDLGFRSYHLAASNFTVWDASPTSDLSSQLVMSIEHVRDGATEEAMLTELLLKAGYKLTSPVKRVSFAGVPGYSISDGALLVCVADVLTIEAFEAMVAVDPAMILVLDAGFGGSDELKVNALQTVRARNQQSGSDIALRVV